MNNKNQESKSKIFQPEYVDKVSAGHAPGALQTFPAFKEPISLSHMLQHKVLLNTYMAAIESYLIIQALQRADGNFAAAAQILGINRTTLVMRFNLVRRFGIDASAYKPAKPIKTEQIKPVVTEQKDSDANVKE